jgi:dipeptidyl-peptidase 4
MRGVWLAAVMVGLAAPVAAQTLTLERVFANPSLAGSAPRAVALSPDGSMVTSLKPRADDQLRSDLWVTDVKTGAQRMLVDSLSLSPAPAQLSEAELARRERARLAGSRGIVEYRWAPDGKTLLVPLDGDIYLAGLDGKARRLTQTAPSETDAKVSPRGGFVSYVREQNLYVYDLAKGAERALTQGGGGAISYGMAEFVAQEEMKRDTGQWWAPDDQRIAIARVDESGVRVATRTAIGVDGTSVTEQRYPFAGTPNAVVTLAIYPLSGGAPVSVDLGANTDIYLARVNWLSPTQLIVQRQNRAQTELDVLLVDATNGQSRLLFQERAKTFVNLHDNLWPLKAPGQFLWSSERDGFQHLYRWTGTALVQLTRGAFVVDQLLAVDEGKREAYVTAFKDTVLEKHVYRIGLDGRSRFTRLTQPGGWHEAVMDRDGRAALITRSTPSQPPQLYLANNAGQRLAWINENAVSGAHPYAPFAAAHVEPRFGTLKAADGQEMHYSLLTPKVLEPGKRYPVFVEVYGGPGVQRVTRSWMRNSPLHQYLLQQGWIVFMLDNRGSANRGTAFENPIHLNVGKVEVDDQLIGLNWLKQQPFVDPARIGLYGWSYGGYMVLRMMTQAPEAVAAGISGAPVTDWLLYDTHYTERYIGNPALDMKPYDASNVVRDAKALTRPMLLIHGLADDNVVFEHSTRMMAALQRGAMPFETMVYPGQTHRIADPALQTHMWRQSLRFLDREVKTKR